MTQAHRLLLKWARTLHVYLTLFGLLLLLFFAVTGFMLNHENWFLPRETLTGRIPTDLLSAPENRNGIVEKLRSDFDVVGDVESFDFIQEKNAYRVLFKSENGCSEVVIQCADGSTVVTNDSDKSREHIMIVEGMMPVDLLVPDEKSKELPIVERLRRDFAARGEVVLTYEKENESYRAVLYEKESESFRAEFKAPGYMATAIIQSKDGQTKVTHHTRGVVGLVLDLHRGKDSGLPWSFVIDLVSILFVVVSITGLILWSSLRARAQSGFAVLILGMAVSLVVYIVWVPR
jgi:hypothetical protein